MASEKPVADNSTAENLTAKDRMTRREAMLQLLRLTAASAGTAAAAVWLAKHSELPGSTAAANVRRNHTVEANAAYLVTSITDPGADIVEGYSNIMPSGKGRYSDDELYAITEAIRKLK